MARPSKFKEEYCESAYNYCLLGATDVQLADFFDVSITTIDTWKVKHPEFLGALKRGKELADAEIAQSLFHRAKGYSHPEDKIFNSNGESLIVPTTKHYPPDTTAAIFWLKNRRKDAWRDQKDHKHEGKVIVEHKDLDDCNEAELEAIANGTNVTPITKTSGS